MHSKTWAMAAFIILAMSVLIPFTGADALGSSQSREIAKTVLR